MRRRAASSGVSSSSSAEVLVSPETPERACGRSAWRLLSAPSWDRPPSKPVGVALVGGSGLWAWRQRRLVQNALPPVARLARWHAEAVDCLCKPPASTRLIVGVTSRRLSAEPHVDTWPPRPRLDGGRPRVARAGSPGASWLSLHRGLGDGRLSAAGDSIGRGRRGVEDVAVAEFMAAVDRLRRETPWPSMILANQSMDLTAPGRMPSAAS
jgi:hypothetical protein